MAETTMGQTLLSTYFQTHRQRLEQSMQMAQLEQQTNLQRLQYLQAQEKNLMDYIQKMGMAGGMSGDAFSKYITAVNIDKDVTSKLNDDRANVVNAVNQAYMVPAGATGSINGAAKSGALNLSSGVPKSQIASVTGYTPGTPGAMAAAIDLYQKMQSEAAANNATQKFNTQKSAIAQEIASVFDVTGLGGAAVIQSPQAFEKARELEITRRQKEEARPALSSTQVESVYKAAGVNKDGTPITPTATATSADGTPVDMQELFMNRLAGIQQEQMRLENELAQGMNAQAIHERGVEIYKDKYTKTREKNKTDKDYRKMMANLSNDEIYYLESSTAADQSRYNPFTSTTTPKEGSVEAKAKTLMETMVANLGSGKPLDVIGLASQLEDDPQKQRLVLGLAMRGVSSHAETVKPTVKIQEQKDDELALETITNEKAAVDAKVDATQQKVDKAKDETEKLMEERIAVSEPTVQPTETKTPSEPPPDVYGGRPGYKPGEENTNAGYEARIREQLKGRASEEEIQRLVKMYGPENNIALEVQGPQGPESIIPLGTVLKGDAKWDWGYEVIGYDGKGKPIIRPWGKIKGRQLTPGMQSDAEKYWKALEKQTLENDLREIDNQVQPGEK